MGDTKVRRRHSALAATVATVAMAVGFTALPAEAAPPRVDYVALGDSYTAGTGAGSFSQTSACVQTAGGYVDLVGNTGRVSTVANYACHGALLFDSESPVPSVGEQFGSAAARLRGAELVSITAGANDLGVGNILSFCLTQPPEACAAEGVLSPADLYALKTALTATYQFIQLQAPEAKIAVFGYPRLFDSSVGFGHLSPEVLDALNHAADALNGTIALAVAESRVNAEFVDVTPRFLGHEVNSADPWIFFVPPTLQGDGSLSVDPRNFHPNPAGHRAYASALVAEVKPAQLARR